MALVAVVVITIIACDLAYGHTTDSLFLSFFLSISLSAARGLRSISRNVAPRFIVVVVFDGRVIVIAIIIITIIACDLPCL